MGVLSWALSRPQNAFADPTIPAQDGASSRAFPDGLRGVMAAARALADDQGGAIVTAGTGNAYRVRTASGVTELRAGVSLLLRVDRANTDAATLAVDGLAPKPWVAADGSALVGGMLKSDRFARVTFDAVTQSWISDVLATLSDPVAIESAVALNTQTIAQEGTLRQQLGEFLVDADNALANRASVIEQTAAAEATLRQQLGEALVEADNVQSNRAAALETRAAKVETRTAVADRMLTGQATRDRALYRRPNVVGPAAYSPASDGFAVFAFGVRTSRRCAGLGSLVLFPADFAGAAALSVRAYIRADETSNAMPGQLSGDAQVIAVDRLLTPDASGLNLAGGPDLIGSPTQRFLWQAIRIDLDGYGPVEASTLLVFSVTALGTDGVTRVPIGWATGVSTVAGVPAIYKGLRATPAAPNAGVALAGNATLPFALNETFAAPATAGAASPPMRTAPTAASLVAPSGSGLTLTMPEIVIESAGQPLVIPSQPLTFQQPGQTSVTDRLPLQFSYLWNTSHQYIGGVSVRRASDNAILAEGVDYTVDPAAGGIIGVKNVATFDVDVTYTADFVRYDMVYANPYVGGAAIAVGPSNAGQGRGGDVNENRAATPASNIPLFRVLVTRSRGVEAVPLYNWSGFVKVGEEAQHAAWLEYNRVALRRFWRKLRAGGTVRLAGYGDSITAQGTGYPTVASPNAFYVPNGDSRDNRSYVATGRYAPATFDTIAPLDGDGRTNLGWCWALKKAIEAASGAVVLYDNWGIGGTHSGPNLRNGVPDGCHPDRLNALVNSVPDLVVVGFGMGEIGSPDTYNQVSAICSFLAAAGIDVIVMGVPLPNKVGFRTAPLDNWRFTNAELARAAADNGVAYSPVHRWCDPRNTGAFGFSYATACNANGSNHPGPAELARYGEMLAQIVPPLQRGMAATDVTALYAGQTRAVRGVATANAITSLDVIPGVALGGYTLKAQSTGAGGEALILQGFGAEGGRLRSGVGNDLLNWNAFGMSFFGAPVSVKPTIAGSRGGNAALASLLSGLAALGLVTDSSTA